MELISISGKTETMHFEMTGVYINWITRLLLFASWMFRFVRLQTHSHAAHEWSGLSYAGRQLRYFLKLSDETYFALRHFYHSSDASFMTRDWGSIPYDFIQIYYGLNGNTTGFFSACSLSFPSLIVNPPLSQTHLSSLEVRRQHINISLVCKFGGFTSDRHFAGYRLTIFCVKIFSKLTNWTFKL
jgi:hypothetical protein